MSKDQLQIDPRAFLESIQTNGEIVQLTGSLSVKTLREADIIDFHNRNPEEFRTRYHIAQYVSQPIGWTGTVKTYGLAQEIAANFTLIYEHGVEHQPLVCYRVGQIGENQIVVSAKGQLLVREDVQTTRPLSDAEILEHALEIENAIEPEKLRNLSQKVLNAKAAPWGQYTGRSFKAPCEDIKPKKIEPNPSMQADITNKRPRDPTQELIQAMIDLKQAESMLVYLKREGLFDPDKTD